jgi:hypothetical protein
MLEAIELPQILNTQKHGSLAKSSELTVIVGESQGGNRHAMVRRAVQTEGDDSSVDNRGHRRPEDDRCNRGDLRLGVGKIAYMGGTCAIALTFPARGDSEELEAIPALLLICLSCRAFLFVE